MKKEKNLVKVFSGAEAPAILLKKRLEETGIEALIKNDSHDAFLGAAPRVVDVYIEEKNIDKASAIIQEMNLTLK
jgi:hypothetical protein